MVATAYCSTNERGGFRSHAAVRLADEGVPIGAIARALKMSFGEATEVIKRAKVGGQIVSMPVRDWPMGQVRYVPTNGPASAQPVGPQSIRIDEARDAIPFGFNLTAKEAELLAGLMTKDLAVKGWLHGIVYGHDQDGGADPKIIDVFVCKLRKKLRPFGIHIETVWGRGYRMTGENRDRVITLKRAEAA